MSCQLCDAPLVLSEVERGVHTKLSGTFGGKEVAIPYSSLCHRHRRQRRWAFRNERQLYRSRCADSGKSIISHLAPHSPYRVIDQKLWWDLSWDGTEYGREIDFTRPFFEQFGELLRSVPHPNLLNALSTNENSDYVNCTTQLQNCYMVFDSGGCQDVLYSELAGESRSCIDCTNILACELCYGCIDSLRCYQGRTLIQCEGCSDSSFLYDCKGCTHCFMSVGLRNASYYWKNEQLQREEYERRVHALSLFSRSVYQECLFEFATIIDRYPRRAAFIVQSEESSGNALVHSSHAVDSYDSTGLHDCAHLISVNTAKDCVHIEHTTTAELSYEVMASTNIYHTLFCAYPISTVDVWYSYLISNARNCFGCACVKNQEYCILNKKYSPDDYERVCSKLVDHMKETGEWGCFFPMEISPFPYNDTLAQVLVPLSQDQAKERSLRWEERTASSYSTSEEASIAPESWSGAKEDLLFHPYRCGISSRLFKLTAQEIELYQKIEVPLPDKHPDERYYERLSWRGARELIERVCSSCAKKVTSVFTEAQVPEVLCDRCYVELVR